MLNYNIKILIIMILLVMNLSSCDRENQFDFRDKYAGKYQVQEELQSYGFPPCGNNFHSLKDTIITVDFGITDSTLIVLGREVQLDSNGFYFAYHYGLHLWNDSISSSFMNGGLGCGRYEIYNGYRISEKH
jgi:hypothetical protein